MSLSNYFKTFLKTLKLMANYEFMRTMSEILDQNLKMKEELSTLKNNQEINNSLKYEKELYWLTRPDSIDGPFCTNCWDVNRKLVRPLI
ncbi:MAG: hypothetical protein HPY50_09375 [Firmicutes bacterium]|nr:hypothetical protein [Bacillota bacterium]